MLVTAAMTALLMQCAPTVGVQTMAGIVEYESGWKPWAIGDNTVRQSYFPHSEGEAIRLASTLLAQGHNLDVGLAQINSDNFATYGLTPFTAFNPCYNLRTGSAILSRAYAGALNRNWIGRPIRSATDWYYEEQIALVHALSAYNSGRYWAAMGYATDVYRLAQQVRVGGFSGVERRK